MPFSSLISGLLDKAKTAGRVATTPLVPQLGQMGAGAEQAISAPQLADADHPLLAMARGFGAGGAKGVGDLLSSMTSPLALAGMAAGGAGGVMGRLLSKAGGAARTAEPLVSELASRVGPSADEISAVVNRAVARPPVINPASLQAEQYAKYIRKFVR